MSDRLPYLYEFGRFRVDPVQHILLRNGEPVPLSPKSFETLLVLVRSRGRLVDKNELLRCVWPDTFVEEATLAQNVFTLRKLLRRDDAGSVDEYIKTVPKRGYRFVATVTEVHDQTDLPEQTWLTNSV